MQWDLLKERKNEEQADNRGFCLYVYVAFIAFSSCVRTFFRSKLRKPGPGAFAVGRGGSKSEELLMVHNICVDTFC